MERGQGPPPPLPPPPPPLPAAESRRRLPLPQLRLAASVPEPSELEQRREDAANAGWDRSGFIQPLRYFWESRLFHDMGLVLGSPFFCRQKWLHFPTVLSER